MNLFVMAVRQQNIAEEHTVATTYFGLAYLRRILEIMLRARGIFNGRLGV